MPELNEERPCPKCAGTMVWDIERKPDGEPIRALEVSGLRARR